MTRYQLVLLSTGLSCLLSGALPAQVVTHLKQIDIFSQFNDLSTLGDNPLSVAFDGINAYVGGYNNQAVPDTVGLLKVENILGSETLTPLGNSVLNSEAFTGYNELEFEFTTGGIFANLDKGSGNVAGNLVQRHDASDGSILWSVNPFSDVLAPQRVKALAIDQADASNGPFLAAIAPNTGRRMGLALDSGATVYGPSGTSPAGGIILGDVNGTVDFGTNWQSLAMDSDGNLATIEQDYVGYTARTGDNTFQSPSGTAERQDEILRKATQTFPGEDLVILEDAWGTGQDALAFSLRDVSTLTQLDGSTQTITSSEVQLRNLDGSTTGLSLTSLTGGENGVGAVFASDIKTLAYGPDASGVPTLLVVDFTGRTLDVYQFVTSPTCDLDGNGNCDTDDLRVLYDEIAAGTSDNDDVAPWLLAAGEFNQKVYLPGDTDLDGMVGGNDFTQLAANFGTIGLPGAYWDEGNFDGNTGGQFEVGGSDFTALAVNFGHVSVAAVPEPELAAAMLMAFVGVTGVIRSRG